MKILVITRGKLPIPNICGGAVEYLIQKMIDENENNWKYEFTILGNYVDNVEKYQSKYKYCKFVNIKTQGLFVKIETAIRFLINTNIKYIGNYFITHGLKMLGDLNRFDLIIDENAPDYIELVRKRFKGRFIFYTHNDWQMNGDMSKISLCDEYWTVSEYLSKKAVENAQIKTDVKTVYNGIELEKFQNVEKNDIIQYKKRYKIDKSIVLIYSGRLVEEKGVLELILAFKKCEFDKDVKLLIAGGSFYDTDKQTSYVKKCYALCKDDDSIILTGYVKNDDMPILYHCADIGIFPSFCQEAFGLSLLEMMACGLPVITTKNGAIPEIVCDNNAIMIDSDTSHFVDELANEIIALVNDEVLRKKLSKNASNRALEFGLERYLIKLDKLIRKEQ